MSGESISQPTNSLILYGMNSPNVRKVVMMLEELAAWPTSCDTSRCSRESSSRPNSAR